MVGRISTETTSVIAYKDDPEEDAGVNIFTKNRKFAARSPNDPTMGWLNLGRCPAIARCKKRGDWGNRTPDLVHVLCCTCCTVVGPKDESVVAMSRRLCQILQVYRRKLIGLQWNGNCAQRPVCSAAYHATRPNPLANSLQVQ